VHAERRTLASAIGHLQVSVRTGTFCVYRPDRARRSPGTSPDPDVV